MGSVSRRIFLKASGAAALTPGALDAAAAAAKAADPQAGARPAPGAASGWMFFNAQEAAFIEAAVVRLIPPDEVGPSALEAAVPTYMDRQLHGAWGAGERLYRSGPWTPGTPQQGYQLQYTPAELFRTALRGIRDDLQKTRQTSFEQLSGQDQDAYLTDLQNGTKDLGGVPAKVFFETLLAMTIEGYFCDPAYGGNKDMAAWRMIGFPGAYAAYYDLVDKHGVTFAGAPRSLGEDGHGHVHEMSQLSTTTTPAPARKVR